MISKERIERIGRFLNDRMVVHRNVENDTPWTTEEKMIQELYDSYLDLMILFKRQQKILMQHYRNKKYIERKYKR